MKRYGVYIESAAHIIFWVFICLSINIQWNVSWFDQSIRPHSPAPLSLLIFIFYFYMHAFLVVPKYFSLRTWKKYVLFTGILFLLPEIIRLVGYHFLFPDTVLELLVFHRDSFFFGAPGVAFMAFNVSLLYGLARLWLISQNNEQKQHAASTPPGPSVPYEQGSPLDEVGAKQLQVRMEEVVRSQSLYLNAGLSLRDLADHVDSTEKKVSYVLNHHLNMSFYEFLNRYRVEAFKKEIIKPENKQLSIIGVAMNCGFPSKSSFYRSFKSIEGNSPSEYLKKVTLSH